jgi:cold-inducible RNA-binding protein
MDYFLIFAAFDCKRGTLDRRSGTACIASLFYRAPLSTCHTRFLPFHSEIERNCGTAVCCIALQSRRHRTEGRNSMKNLFVGNMNFQTTAADLRALFEPFGQLARVHLATDRETGRARGFGFVEMPNDEEAAKAIAALDGKEIGGRSLKVNEARPKSESSGLRGSRGPHSGGGGGRSRERFSNEDYREVARQPREPRW